ncbi:MAG: DNA polymerase I, partial [Rhodospirillales bacterium]|nr:DNA polymerase I [Rhodospirillales bacterium]
RNDLYPEYKAHRPDPPEELIPQFPLVRDATRAFNVAAVDQDGYEADDLIATYARQAAAAGSRVTIVSSDKDLMQLVDDRITMFDAVKNREIGRAEVIERFGVGPEKVVEVQALAGDSTDNVPGVAGIGVKTAAELIKIYGDVETLLARAHEIKQPKRRQALIDEADAARLSRKLVELCCDVPVLVPLADLAVKPRDNEQLLKFLRAQAFKSLIARIESRVEAGARPKTPLAATATASMSDAAAVPAVAADRSNYELVQDVTRLKAWVQAAKAQGYVAVDTETTALDSMRAELVGVSLALEPGRACYIPLGHKPPAGLALDGAQALQQIPLAEALAILEPLLEDAAVLKIGQNIKYDMQILAQHGIAVGPVDDTMVLSFVLDGSLHGHGMDELALLHLGHTTIKYSDVTGTGKAQVTFDFVPLDKARDYSAEDADVTLKLHKLLKRRLVAESMVTVYETLERPLIPILERMERHGITVDARELKRLSGDFGTRMAGLETEIHKLVGQTFNLGSPKQLGEVLFDKMGLAGGRKTKTGAWGTDADVLDDLAAQGHVLPAKILEWRQLAKLKSTYADALIEQINPQTGRVHTSYSMAAASTGRLASTDPNLQNIPVRTEEGRKIRHAFIATKGHTLISADYSQIELRLLAHVADIETLKEAFRQGADIHALTASQVFGIPLDKLDAATRRSAKAINFGIIYGISPFGLARQLGIGQGDAKRYIEAYFERYPGIRDYMDRTKKIAREQGFVTTPFGRKCHMPGIADKNPARRNFAERAAINAPLQGGAADIIKRAMVRIPDALVAAKLAARMLLQVHDELIFEVPDAEVEATGALVKAIMEAAATLTVPLVVDVGSGTHWDEAH